MVVSCGGGVFVYLFLVICLLIVMESVNPFPI